MSLAAHMGTSSSIYLGLLVGYEYEGAEIEMSNSSDDMMIIIPQYQGYEKIKDWDKYSEYDRHSPCKKVLHSECPLVYFESYVGFQWAPVAGWSISERGKINLRDFITFIARIDGNIVGYAVVYAHSDGNIGRGDVVADKEFPKVDGEYQQVSEEAVNNRIQAVIKKYK